MAYDNTGPNEILTVMYCGACENPSFFEEGGIDNSQLRCPICGHRLGAKDIYDYVDMEVVEYE